MTSLLFDKDTYIITISPHNSSCYHYSYCYDYAANTVIYGGSIPFYNINSTDNIFLSLIGPQVMNGMALILVSMTTLKFICAQVPISLKGLLLGIWYAIFSMQYLTSQVCLFTRQ